MPTKTTPPRQLDYRDFEIEIREVPGGYEVRALDPRGPRTSGRFTLPFTGETLEALLQGIENRIRYDCDGLREVRRKHRATRGRGLDAQGLSEAGGELFRSLLPEKVEARFRQVMGELGSSQEGDGLRLRLSFDPEQSFGVVAHLPWEILHDGREHLAQRRRFPLVRYLGTGQSDPEPIEGAPQVLVIDAGGEDLDSAGEVRGLREAMEGLDPKAVTWWRKPSIEDLRFKLDRGGFHVVHFIGHGRFDQDERGSLCFGPREKPESTVTAALFADVMKDLPELRLVVLNSCWGAKFPRHHGVSPFQGTAAALVAAGVPAVVAMQMPISDPAALAFSRGFYGSLAAGDPVEAAVSEGRLAIRTAHAAASSSGGETVEWLTPSLFLSTRDGRLFTPSKRDSRPALREQGEKPSPEPLHLGIRSFPRAPGVWGEVDQAEELLDLSDLFDPSDGGRFIRDPALWAESAYPRLEKFLLQHANPGRPLELDMAAHGTLAFAAGRILEAKSGLDITVIQRGRGGSGGFRLPPNPGPSATEPLWKAHEERTFDPESFDVALACAVTREEVLPDVDGYIEEEKLAIGRRLQLSVLPEPHQKSVKDGHHALELAHQASQVIQRRSYEERKATLHLFWSAPNAWAFFLGQLSRPFRRVQLYEHDFEGLRGLMYFPSLRLPT